MSKRSPLITFLFSLVYPGFGYMYIGEVKKTILSVIFLYGFYIVFGVLGFFTQFKTIVIFATVVVLFQIFLIISSVVVTFGKSDYEAKWYNKWFYYLLAIFMLSTPYLAFAKYRGEFLGYETFKVVSKSMEPTLIPGDQITVDTKCENIGVGDIIVFKYPENRNIPYLFRVAAVGESSIYIENGMVHVDDIEIPVFSNKLYSLEREHSLSMEKISIPQSKYFVLGDNRDNSRDSRFWGLLDKSDIIGCPTYIVYSDNFDRIGTKIQ